MGLEKVRVLEVCLGDFGTGGGGVLMWGLYQNIDRDKFQIDFFCYQKPECSFIREIEYNGGNCWYRKLYRNKFVQKFSEYIDVRRVVKAGRYDCVHLHFSNAYIEYLLFLASKKYVDKVLCHSHNTNMKGGTAQLIAHEFSKNRLRGSKIIPVASSKDAAKWLFPRSVIDSNQYIIIKNGIDTPKFVFNAGIRASIRKQLGIEESFVIGHVGRFAYAKNHEFLIDIFAEVKKKCPNAVLLLIGDDSGENLINGVKEKVDSLGLSESVIFYGNTDRVNEMYQAMDCLVFPSRYEGLGIVAIEAQAAGLRTLCSDGVPREAQITELLEYMPLLDGPEKWAEKILTYNDGYERKNMAEEITAAGYDIKASAKQLETIYLRCARKKAKTVL